MGTIHSAVDEGVLVLTLDNRGANSIDLSMASRLASLIEARGPDIGAVVVTGKGEGAFCAGSDLGELKRAHDAGEGPAALLEAENRAFDRLAALDIPTLAAINGVAVGGGVELSACCDIVYAADTATFSLPEIRLGVFPGIGGTVRIPRRVGYSRAMELMLTGRTVQAPEALQIGLAHRIIPPDDVLAETLKLARRFAKGPPKAIAALKGAMRRAWEMPEREALADSLAAAIALGASADVAEGLRAFFAKEEPRFPRREAD
ncbi:MAG: enoyl-CoA hydratase/isomerase family protein [Rhizobiaceae bacterium]